MTSFKWNLCLLYFHLKVIHTETNSWTITVPSLIEGLPGSCVVIPCSFDFPDTEKKATKFTGMWKDGDNQLIYHSNAAKIMPTFCNRTRLLGNLTQKNCSLQIDPLKDSDQGPFFFRIEIAQLDNFSYLKNTVSISKIDKGGPMSLSVKGRMRVGRTASVSCSVTHSCPTSPPVFTWSHLGREDIQHTQLNHGQQRTTSTLSFQPSREDHNKLLRCSIRYKGGQQQEERSLLKVMYVPEIRNVSHCTSEAKLITCLCVVESNPPSRLQFVVSNMTVNGTTETNGTVTVGILQVEQRPHKFIQCLASNKLATVNLTLSVTVHHSTTTTNLYIIIIILTVGGGVVLLTLLILATVVQTCRHSRDGDICCLSPSSRRTEGQQTSQLEMDRHTASLPTREEENVHGDKEGRTFSYNLYENVETYMHEPVYANM